MPFIRVIGAGRAGSSLAGALEGAGWVVDLRHHGADLSDAAVGCDLLVLAVPDGAVAEIAARVPVGSAVIAHLAGALGLDVLAPHPRRASLHPMVPLPDPETGARRLAGAWFAIDGDPIAEDVVVALAGRAVRVAGGARASHHAAAVMASNHVVALLGSLERVAGRAGVPLEAELDLVRAAVDDVAAFGPAKALTGPVARGDWATVDGHVRALAPEERPAYLALAAEAARLAGRTLPAGIGRVAAGGPAEPVVLDTREAFAKTLDAARRSGRTVGLVPTMGALHDGHLALIRRAAAECDLVAVTVFVNPLQFDRSADLAAYPRTLDADVDAAAGAGAGVVFAPTVAEMYGPTGKVATSVHVGGLADRLEGASRPGHFDGVATVVTKLFSLAGPCRAYFGEKDFQQLAVVRQLAADLSLPVDVVGCPTVRAGDGLALSSRNALLTPEERVVAPLIHAALRRAADAALGGERNPERLVALVTDAVASERRFRLDRVDVVDAATLEPPSPATAELRILVSAFLGQARLIDNLGVTV